MSIEDLDSRDMAGATSQGARSDTPQVLLSHVFTTGQRHHARARLKRSVFLGCASLVMAGVGFLTVAIAHFAVDLVWLTKPYFWLASAGAVAVGVMTLVSRPDRQRSARGILDEWVEAGREVLIAAVILMMVAFLWHPESIRTFSFSRGTILAVVPIGFITLGAARTALRGLLLALRRRGHNLANIVVIGDGPSAASFMRTIAAKRGTGYRVVAHVTEAQATHNLSSVIERLAADLPIDEVVVASFDLPADQISEIVSHPAMRETRVRTVPELFGLPPSKVQVVDFADFPLLTLFENPVRGPRWKVKRALDVVVAAVAILVLSPILLAIAAAIRLTSDGPILFRQQRVGMDGKRFDVIKFRTMTAGAPDAVHREFMTAMLSGATSSEPASAGFYKLTDDPRVTRVGKFLRRYSLDELPQLINVLRTEMSLVGPRPALSYEVDLYEEWQRRRLDVLPGMTGLWQVSGRSRLSPADMLRLDVHYAETWSLPKDFLIMLRTIPAVLRDNAR